MSAQESSPDSTDVELDDLEIKDAQLIFSTVWELLEERVGREGLRFPRELRSEEHNV